MKRNKQEETNGDEQNLFTFECVYMCVCVCGVH